MSKRAEQVAQLVGKKIAKIIKVKVKPKKDETFSVCYAYEKKVKALGYQIGSMARSEPRALGKGFDYIAKWYNIGREDYPLIEGVVLCDDNRNGKEAEIVIFE